MDDTKYTNKKVVSMDGEQFLKIGSLAKPFWERGISENPPNFVIFMGGIGSGKTTIRRQQHDKDYVHFDFGEIFNVFEKEYGKDNPQLSDYAMFACGLILKESLMGRKNIVIEIIGDNHNLIFPVIDKMKGIGYDVILSPIVADIEESRIRHLKATKEDKDYISSYYTQEATLSFFYQYFELGEMPPIN